VVPSAFLVRILHRERTRRASHDRTTSSLVAFDRNASWIFRRLPLRPGPTRRFQLPDYRLRFNLTVPVRTNGHLRRSAGQYSPPSGRTREFLPQVWSSRTLFLTARSRNSGFPDRVFCTNRRRRQANGAVKISSVTSRQVRSFQKPCSRMGLRKLVDRPGCYCRRSDLCGRCRARWSARLQRLQLVPSGLGCWRVGND